MSKLTKTVPTTKQVPVNVVKLKWNEPIKETSVLAKLSCTACLKPIGSKRWGLAWAKDKKGDYALRLCEACGEKAEQALKTSGKVKDG